MTIAFLPLQIINISIKTNIRQADIFTSLEVLSLIVRCNLSSLLLACNRPQFILLKLIKLIVNNFLLLDILIHLIIHVRPVLIGKCIEIILVVCTLYFTLASKFLLEVCSAFLPGCSEIIRFASDREDEWVRNVLSYSYNWFVGGV